MAKAGNTTQANERRVLRKYLARYYRAKDKRSILQGRLRALKRELDRGGFMPPSPVQEIEAKIQRQTEAAEKNVLEIMELLERLPPDSTERTILELRHIDCKTWADISRTVYLTRTPCAKYYNRGLDALLRMSKVRRTLGLEERAGG